MMVLLPCTITRSSRCASSPLANTIFSTSLPRRTISSLVWRWETLREWDEVADEARCDNKEVHFGYMFGIMVEKGFEFPEGDERRYFKYRVVFQGNQVKDQNWEVAMFSETASTPATFGGVENS